MTRDRAVVLTSTSRGWRVLRPHVPGRPRSGPPFRGVPRPPEHAASAEVLGRTAAPRPAELAPTVPELLQLLEQGEAVIRLVRDPRSWPTLIVRALLAARHRNR